jgi:hypothetical protein
LVALRSPLVRYPLACMLSVRRDPVDDQTRRGVPGVGDHSPAS